MGSDDLFSVGFQSKVVDEVSNIITVVHWRCDLRSTWLD